MKEKQKLSKPRKGVRLSNLTLLYLIFHICLERGALPPFKFPGYSSNWETFYFTLALTSLLTSELTLLYTSE